MPDITHALLNSLSISPLLIGNLPNADSFDRSLFQKASTAKELNLHQKLGHLYEQALGLMLDLSANTQIIGQNIQIYDAHKKTLGELDFIVHDLLLDRYIHLELGVKFYLAYKAENEWFFPGPNDRDNWPKKLARLQDHQLTLTKIPEAHQLLRNSFNIKDITTQQLIYGCLFVPINHQGPEPKLEFMAKEARIAKWLYAEQWQDYLSDHELVYVIPKMLWPVIPHNDFEPFYKSYTAEDFLIQFRGQGAMFVSHDFKKTYYLAPEGWPVSFKTNAMIENQSE